MTNHNDNIAVLLNNRLQMDIEVDRSQCSSPSLSQSEAEYETCDSGVSEQSSLSDESSTNHNQSPRLPPQRYSRSPSPTIHTNSITPTQHSTNQRHKPTMNPLHQQQQQQSNLNNARTPKTIPPKLPHRSIISDVFDGKLLSSVQCLTCDRVSTREETFQDLSLPIPGKDHLTVLHQSGFPATTPVGVSSATEAVT